MEAKLADKNTLRLTENGQWLGDLKYKNLIFLKAEIRQDKFDRYELNPVGIFGTSITVRKNGEEMADLQMDWRGHIKIAFQDGREFILKAKGAFCGSFIMESKNGEKLIRFNPIFNWRKFNYDYNITFDNARQDIIVVLLGIYASNYFISSMAGSMA